MVIPESWKQIFSPQICQVLLIHYRSPSRKLIAIGTKHGVAPVDLTMGEGDLMLSRYPKPSANGLTA